MDYKVVIFRRKKKQLDYCDLNLKLRQSSVYKSMWKKHKPSNYVPEIFWYQMNGKNTSEDKFNYHKKWWK